MDKMGWLADRRTRRLAWLGGVFLTVTAVVAVFAVVVQPASDSRHPASTRPPDRATARSSPVRSPVRPVSSPPATWQVESPIADLSTPLPGMPPVTDPANIYADAGANMLSPAVRGVPYRIYVPNSGGSTVTVIDPATYRVIGTYQTGLNPQHVVPAYDMRTLYVTNDLGNSLTPINPWTGRPPAATSP